MTKLNNSIQAPPWLIRLASPFLAKTIARNMINKFPGLSADTILAKMRADIGETNAQTEQLLQAVARYLPANPKPVTERQAIHPAHWYSPSSLVLIAANLIPLYGVLVLDWPVFPMMLLFWLENVVIGILNALRMLLADPVDLVSWAAKLFMVPFFSFHFGMFTAIHGIFVVSIFGGKTYRQLDHGLWPIEGVRQAITDFDIRWALIALLLSHVFSFVWNYLLRGEYRCAALKELMQRPYRRVIILHLTILIGGGITMVLGSPIWALVMLIVLKTGFDLRAHIQEHRKTAV